MKKTVKFKSNTKNLAMGLMLTGFVIASGAQAQTAGADGANGIAGAGGVGSVGTGGGGGFAESW